MTWDQTPTQAYFDQAAAMLRAAAAELDQARDKVPACLPDHPNTAEAKDQAQKAVMAHLSDAWVRWRQGKEALQVGAASFHRDLDWELPKPKVRRSI